MNKIAELKDKQNYEEVGNMNNNKKDKKEKKNIE